MTDSRFSIDVAVLDMRDSDPFLREATEKMTRETHRRTSTIERGLRERGIVVGEWRTDHHADRLGNGDLRFTVDLSIAEMHDATMLDFRGWSA